MNICLALQLYVAMANAHADVPANQQKIGEGAQFLQAECQAYQKEQEKEKKVEKPKTKAGG